MNNKIFLKTVGVIFSLIAVLHFFRLVFGWEAVIGGWMVPVWLSVVALVIASVLAYKAFKYIKQ
ncbi:MAG: hypothetical protein A3I24_02265 [Candidatus Harrisonbacteria bacterium RIFCSPLOWO2_02_FULL_41_13b]|uniref:Uncharacterized protein n=1 Tax=Candidatus Harrisonbacteria bacterium RIFCSPLOWO2_02_FULL_41_13b TaxID=1798409 RepID=A0A1G1ZUR4_9BACT|nr:MAG: hypothetical protein A3J53_03470 [Candidatus Harrisonbacteria bacterium RIFCSPHIGHO2_02_FULL_40_20]OGY68231.1 MAG: hypothetical protein A3I24_02265 [Candidatus Harrisonbacteria bacterium RIFCSPLOWO2_02_FULL_41_13b]